MIKPKKFTDFFSILIFFWAELVKLFATGPLFTETTSEK